MNYSETYFELDSEEATHCHHCHLISCVYIKGLVNTEDQSNSCMCEMMSKESKEALGGMVGKVLVSAFQNFLLIENPLNIKEVMNKTVKGSFDSFDMSNMSNN